VKGLQGKCDCVCFGPRSPRTSGDDPLPTPDPTRRAMEMAVAMREAAAEVVKLWCRHGHGIGSMRPLGRIGFADRSRPSLVDVSQPRYLALGHPDTSRPALCACLRRHRHRRRAHRGAWHPGDARPRWCDHGRTPEIPRCFRPITRRACRARRDPWPSRGRRDRSADRTRSPQATV
jgi:hypothetical protein